MTLRLQRVTGRARRCGPAAVSAFTGLPTHDAAALIRRYSKRQRVIGTNAAQLRYALDCCGVSMVGRILTPRAPDWARAVDDLPTVDARRLTMAAFLDPTPAGAWLIATATHWIAYAQGEVADSGAWYARRPQPWGRDVAKRRAYMACAFQLEHAA